MLLKHRPTFPSATLINSSATNRAVRFLFEGVTKGSGKLWLELRYEGITLAKYPVPMNLKPVGEFVEEYSVSQPDDNDQDNDPLPVARAEQTIDAGSNPDKDYILWVHGWNWADWQKKAYGYSTFKRLYWLGFKGTFGIYKWPGTYGLTSALSFDESERHALLAGQGLRRLIAGDSSVTPAITGLTSRGFKVHVYAHSQGCMVTSEALRQIALDGQYQKPVVDSMTFSQAAVSARMYDGSYQEYDDWSGLRNNLIGVPLNVMRFQSIFGLIAYNYFSSCPAKPQWPDLQGHFPYHLERPAIYAQPVYDPYFKPVQDTIKTDSAGNPMMFNFYNPSDYPTGDYGNVTPSNLMEAFSGSWLVDQLIKPFRALSFPVYGERAYKMVYGGGGLSYDEKVLFVHDLNRQDRYCISAWNSPCGEQSGCTDFPIYDLSDTQVKYSMIAYGCAGYSRTLGGRSSSETLDPSSGFGANSQVNLQSDPFFYGPYVMWHGAQFRGMAAAQRGYWKKFLENIGLRQSGAP